jgi:hypothetical protein
MSTDTFPGPAPAWCLWRNPILRRYFRTRLRPRALGATLLMVLLIAGFIFAMARTGGITQMEFHQRMAEEAAAAGRPAPQGFILSMESVERICLIPLLIFQGFILFIAGTGQVAGGMTAEAEEGTMDYMRLSPMTPLAKVLGYLIGLPIREWLAFAVTLPFTAWGLWRGAVPAANWVPVYAVVLVAAVLYHLTGLTAGTVMRNRRWAFLIAMGSVFLLYTVIPQLAKLGLVYFEYLTIMPVVTENMSGFMPVTAGALFGAAQQMQANTRFFGLGFPESVFTIFSQFVLCLTFCVMLWRRWRKAESHLLGKAWATGLGIWIQIVLLGCSLPLISPGLLFISRRLAMSFRGMMGDMTNWQPQLSEAITMIAVYGTVTLLSVIILSVLIAPARERQAVGTRRASRVSSGRIPLFSDESSALVFVLVISVAGAAGWTVFARSLMGSHWFPGQELPAWAPLAFGLVILTASLCCVLLYELRGAKGLFLAGVFVGLVPLLAGCVIGAATGGLSVPAVWVISMSPLIAPANAVITALPDVTGNQTAFQLSGPRAFLFWQSLMVIATVWLWTRHRAERKARALEGVTAGTATD